MVWFGGVPKEKGFLCMQISIAWPPNALTISHCVKQIPQGGFSQTYSGSPFLRLYVCPEVSYSISGLGFAVHLLRRNLHESNPHVYFAVHDAMPKLLHQPCEQGDTVLDSLCKVYPYIILSSKVIRSMLFTKLHHIVVYLS